MMIEPDWFLFLIMFLWPCTYTSVEHNAIGWHDKHSTKDINTDGTAYFFRPGQAVTFKLIIL